MKKGGNIIITIVLIGMVSRFLHPLLWNNHSIGFIKSLIKAQLEKVHVK